MNLPTEVFENVVVVHTPEELGGEQSGVFATHVSEMDHANVVLDVDDTETLDSKGLEAVLEAQDRLRARGGDVKLATSNPINRKIFEITRLDQQLEMFDSVVDAVKSFR